VEAFGQSSGVDSMAKLQPVKAFLKYAYDSGMTPGGNLATHLKVKRAPTRPKQAASAILRNSGPTARLSAEGHQKAIEELETLKSQRVTVAEEIKRAMADKDFRENAPLDAARDQQAHLEARIRELEQVLRSAEIISDGMQSDSGRSRIGSNVVVWDMEAEERITYTLVDPKEVDLSKGRISVESPVGKAFLNKRPGDIAEVMAPAGARRYKVEGVDGLMARAG
jgi:transcription elongation factor GreA